MKAMDAQRAPAMRPYGATDYGGDVHLTLESDDGAPSNANRGHGVSTTMPRLGVTGPVRGMGRARRRLDLGGEVDVRGGCDRGWHVACAAGVAFIAGIALALALVASSAGGGDQLRALVAAAPRQKIITRSLPGLSEARTAALAKPRTAAPVDIDDGRPTVTVGFESSGDFYWLPMVRLLEAALPGVRLRLADPTYDWSAVSVYFYSRVYFYFRTCTGNRTDVVFFILNR